MENNASARRAQARNYRPEGPPSEPPPVFPEEGERAVVAVEVEQSGAKGQGDPGWLRSGDERSACWSLRLWAAAPAAWHSAAQPGATPPATVLSHCHHQTARYVDDPYSPRS